MAVKVRTVGEYLRELEKAKKDKPDQILDALEIYLELWKRALEKGTVKETDPIAEALAKVEQNGGLYKAAE